MPHGSDLICSHSICRNGGVKFLYCAYCDAPVARRSFRTQHIHKGEKLPGTAKAANIAGSIEESSVNFKPGQNRGSEGSEGPRKRLRTAAGAAALCVEGPQDPRAEKEPRIPSLLVEAAVARFDAENASNNSGRDRNQKKAKNNDGRVRALHAVTSGSDTTTSSSDTNSDRGGTSSDPGSYGDDANRVVGGNATLGGIAAEDEESRIRASWMGLLRERSGLRTSTDMTNWLTRVLAISERVVTEGVFVSPESETNTSKKSGNSTKDDDGDRKVAANSEDSKKEQTSLQAEEEKLEHTEDTESSAFSQKAESSAAGDGDDDRDCVPMEEVDLQGEVGKKFLETLKGTEEGVSMASVNVAEGRGQKCGN
jgi:hypothetical protein